MTKIEPGEEGRSLNAGIIQALGAVAALPALSQTPAPSGPPKPAPEVAQLAFFAGEWSCKGKAEASPMGPECGGTIILHDVFVQRVQLIGPAKLVKTSKGPTGA